MVLISNILENIMKNIYYDTSTEDLRKYYLEYLL